MRGRGGRRARDSAGWIEPGRQRTDVAVPVVGPRVGSDDVVVVDGPVRIVRVVGHRTGVIGLVAMHDVVGRIQAGRLGFAKASSRRWWLTGTLVRVY